MLRKTGLACGVLLAIVMIGFFARSDKALLSKSAPPQARLLQSYGKLPLSFEANRGQTDKQVKFLSRGAGYALFLTPTEAVLSLKAETGQRTKKESVLPVSNEPKSAASKAAVVRIRLEHATGKTKVSGIDELAGKSNYFIGNDSAQWRRDIPTFGGVKYQGIYSGVDLIYYGNQRQLEYDFVVAPGADPRQIELSFAGANRLRLDAAGNLVVSIAGGEIVEHTPVIYQDIEGIRQRVTGGYELRSGHTVGFKLAAYDHREQLTIDPSLVYATYLGGSDADGGAGIAVDSSGNAYITGDTLSTNFPTAGALQTTYGGGRDAFVAKLNASGTALIYSTYLGGSDLDAGHLIAVDSLGNAYITGLTRSSDFPTTAGALQTTSGGGFDAFISKLNSSGSALIYSTYLGGSNDDVGFGIAVDTLGNAYVNGYTFSSNFPTTVGALQTTFGGVRDAFVSKVNSSGSALIYSTFMGGSNDDVGASIVVDSIGNAYVNGYTNSIDFPTTAGAFQTTLGGGYDQYISKLNSSGSALIYSTYLGGSGSEQAQVGIAVDSSGNAYVAGGTQSTNFPTTPGALQTAFGGGADDAFVSKLNSSGSALIYSTYLGGSNVDVGEGIALDSSGNAFVTGYTNSSDFPTTAGAPQTTIGGGFDVFVSTLNSNGSALIFSTYMGGSNDEFIGPSPAVDSSGNAYVTGSTASSDFPTTAGAFQTTFGGGSGDAFIAKIGNAAPPPNCNTISISGSMEGNLAIAAGSTVQAGYDFTMPGSHPDAHVTFTNGSVTLQVTCPDNSVHPLIIDLPTLVYDDPQNSSAWLPSGDQSSSLVFQGSTISTVCGTQTGHAPKGATFTAQVCSDDAVNKVNVRFHYRDNSSGGWSGTKSVTP